MQISTKDWKNYIAKLSKLNATAAEKMQQYIAKHGFADTEAIIDYAYGLVTKYGEGSAALSAQMFETIAEMEGAVIQPAVMAQTASRNEVAKMVNGIMKQTQNENVIANAVGRKVKQAGADTTLQNALRYGAEFAWIPAGDTCAFCIALASRGWQLASKNAIKNGHAEHIHSNCDCTYAIRFDSKTHIEGYDPKYYERMYYDAQDRAAEEGTFWSGKSDKDAINQMRRDKYKLNAEKIREQHRAAYAKRQMDFRHERDTDNPFVSNVKEGTITAKGITRSPNGIYVSDKLNIKPKKLQEIENNVTQFKKMIGVEGKVEPKIVLVADTELGKSGGRYVAAENTLYFKVFEDKNVERHMNLHELFHWEDSQQYINAGNIINSDEDVIDYMCEKSKRILDKKGITADNVGEISIYARHMYNAKRFDEVYVEYRTVEGLKNANFTKGITRKT
ncbi:hypothetical protein SAMN04487830_12950 [Pseudobutyrivibrio sp. OR37]|uniref:VG15 protein n=1 Tax=Pseudobutyrivibrio sp. OR37 TaxID=1798186 RepID=UPI0008ED7F14|nr:hypothetical protein [Pseudobutyrivibrio sp. OR37]SFI19856.1 hypothetical protein SAMN04487830_12950 [Pseudobutyrivibrio sp. OR37]